MNKKNLHIMQGALRAGVCLFMLSGPCVLSAQTVSGSAPAQSSSSSRPSSRYEMKEISGFVYDAATGAPSCRRQGPGSEQPLLYRPYR